MEPTTAAVSFAGIGKTVWLYDSMYEYAIEGHTIIFHGWDQPDLLYCFKPDGVWLGPKEAFKTELEDPNTV